MGIHRILCLVGSLLSIGIDASPIFNTENVTDTDVVTPTQLTPNLRTSANVRRTAEIESVSSPAMEAIYNADMHPKTSPKIQPRDAQNPDSIWSIEILMVELCQGPAYLYNAWGYTSKLIRPDGSADPLVTEKQWLFNEDPSDSVRNIGNNGVLPWEGSLWIQRLTNKDRTMNFRFGTVGGGGCEWNEKDTDTNECGSCQAPIFSDHGTFGAFRCDGGRYKARVSSSFL